MKRNWSCAALAVSCLAAPLAAQHSTFTPGSRVRVTRPGRSVLVGPVIRSATDSLWVGITGHSQPEPVVLQEGTVVDRSLGRGNRVWQGALVGVVVGAAATALFLSGFCGGDTLCNGDEQLRAIPIIGLPAVALGAGIGALIRYERWGRAYPPDRGSLVLGLAIRW